MTTIAYKDGIIAYDSRIMATDYIVTNEANKHYVRNGVHFFLAGLHSDFDKFISVYMCGGSIIAGGAEISAIVWDGKALYLSSVDDDKLWKHKIICQEAIGSGYKYALAAMDCGKSASEAVKIAAGRDPSTGGKIRVYKINH